MRNEEPNQVILFKFFYIIIFNIFVETNNIFQTKQVQEIGMVKHTSEKDPAHSLLTALENGNDDEYPNQNVSLKRKSSTILENHNYCSLKKPLQIWCRIPNNVHQVLIHTII